MFKFMKRNKQEPESFESLARKASEHEDCFILAAFPKLPGQPDESIIDEVELGDVILRAVENYLAEVQRHADFVAVAEAEIPFPDSPGDWVSDEEYREWAASWSN